MWASAESALFRVFVARGAAENEGPAGERNNVVVALSDAHESIHRHGTNNLGLAASYIAVTVQLTAPDEAPELVALALP